MLNGDVLHYRDKNNLECDAVIHLRNGKYGLVEVKLGGKTAIDQGAANLKKLSSLIDDEKMNMPSFLMVLTVLSSFAYRREDGVCRSGRLSDLLAVLSGKISMKFVLFGIPLYLYKIW